MFASTDTVLAPKLATARSGLPSPLKSAAARTSGFVPDGEGLLGGEGGGGRPVRRRVQQHRHRAVADVGDGEVGSAVAVEVGRRHGVGAGADGEGLWAAKAGAAAPAAVVFSSTDTVSLLKLATARSGLPSPLKSATARESGPVPTAKVFWAAKAGAVAPTAAVFSSTDTLLSVMLATARSGLPSPLKSPTASGWGPEPTAKVTCAAKEGAVAPAGVVLSSTDTVLSCH